MNWYLKVLMQYANFKGRARRKEYWMFFLFHVIFGIVLMTLDQVIGINFGESSYGPLYLIYTLAVFIPTIAAMVRRLHDTGKTGWMGLVILIPLIGIIWWIILMVKDSNPGANQYGENPKEALA